MGGGGILRSPGIVASPISLLSMGGVCGRSLTAGKILFTGKKTCSLYLVLWLCGSIFLSWIAVLCCKYQKILIDSNCNRDLQIAVVVVGAHTREICLRLEIVNCDCCWKSLSCMGPSVQKLQNKLQIQLYFLQLILRFSRIKV